MKLSDLLAKKNVESFGLRGQRMGAEFSDSSHYEGVWSVANTIQNILQPYDWIKSQDYVSMGEINVGFEGAIDFVNVASLLLQKAKERYGKDYETLTVRNQKNVQDQVVAILLPGVYSKLVQLGMPFPGTTKDTYSPGWREWGEDFGSGMEGL